MSLPAHREKDDVLRDLPEIARRARQNDAADARFRVHLKVHLPLSNPELDAVVRETTDAVWSKIDCLGCGNCCRSLQIVVDDKDIRRLSKRLKMTPAAFARSYVGLADDGTMFFAQSPPCPFLGDGNACTVYEDRPKACRDFPYLHDPHFRSRSLTMRENVATCPIVYNVWERLKARFMPSDAAPAPKKRKPRAI